MGFKCIVIHFGCVIDSIVKGGRKKFEATEQRKGASLETETNFLRNLFRHFDTRLLSNRKSKLKFSKTTILDGILFKIIQRNFKSRSSLCLNTSGKKFRYGLHFWRILFIFSTMRFFSKQFSFSWKRFRFLSKFQAHKWHILISILPPLPNL